MIEESLKKFITEFAAYTSKTKGQKVYDLNKESGKITLPIVDLEMENQNVKAFWRAFYSLIFGENCSSIFFLVNQQASEIEKIILIWSESGKYPQNVEFLDKNALRISYAHLESLEMLYEAIKPLVKDKYNCNLANIYIIDKSVFEEVNHSLSEKCDFLCTLSILADAFIDPNSNRVRYYPKNDLVEFLIALKKFLNNASFASLYQIYKSSIPEMDVLFSFLFNGVVIPFGITISKKEFTLKSYELDKIPEDTATQDFFDNFITKYNHKISFLVSANKIKELITNLCQLEIPPTKERLNWFLQSAIFAYRQMERDWWISPRPKFQNGFVRLLFRMMGYNVNPQKLAHWVIPELIISMFNRNFGLKNRMIMILGEKKAIPVYLLVEAKNATIEKIEPLQHLDPAKFPVLDQKLTLEKLRLIRSEFSKSHGFINAVVYIDKKLIKSLLEIIIVDLHYNGMRPLKNITNTFSLFKDKNGFLMYPIVPLYNGLLNYSGNQNIKWMLDIITEIYEF